MLAHRFGIWRGKNKDLALQMRWRLFGLAEAKRRISLMMADVRGFQLRWSRDVGPAHDDEAETKTPFMHKWCRFCSHDEAERKVFGHDEAERRGFGHERKIERFYYCWSREKVSLIAKKEWIFDHDEAESRVLQATWTDSLVILEKELKWTGLDVWSAMEEEMGFIYSISLTPAL